jgi:hypothetical protein
MPIIAGVGKHRGHRTVRQQLNRDLEPVRMGVGRLGRHTTTKHHVRVRLALTNCTGPVLQGFRKKTRQTGRLLLGEELGRIFRLFMGARGIPRFVRLESRAQRVRNLVSHGRGIRNGQQSNPQKHTAHDRDLRNVVGLCLSGIIDDPELAGRRKRPWSTQSAHKALVIINAVVCAGMGWRMGLGIPALCCTLMRALAEPTPNTLAPSQG